jgi:hypothetical protein
VVLKNVGCEVVFVESKDVFDGMANVPLSRTVPAGDCTPLEDTWGRGIENDVGMSFQVENSGQIDGGGFGGYKSGSVMGRQDWNRKE